MREGIISDLFKVGVEATVTPEEKRNTAMKKLLDGLLTKIIITTEDIEDIYVLLPLIKGNIEGSKLYVKDNLFYVEFYLKERESLLKFFDKVIRVPEGAKLLTEDVYELLEY